MALPRLRTLGLYVGKRAQRGTEVLRWGAEILSNETCGAIHRDWFRVCISAVVLADELQQRREEDMSLV